MQLQESTSTIDEIFLYAQKQRYGDVHIKFDDKTGLTAIVAIHSTKRGPALGGCRCIEYSNTIDALRDAVRLGRAMSYKAAITGLNYGGGKAVIMRPQKISDRVAYFQAFGRFVNELGGRYITAPDSGTDIDDMDIIATQTRYVSCTSENNTFDGDPAPFTARGVLEGIKAAVKFKLKRDNLNGLHVALQGLGHVGHELASLLHQKGAKLTVCDTNPTLTEQCIKEFNAAVAPTEEIHKVDCDVFAPCALGEILHEESIPELNAPIVAGAANNQLAKRQHSQLLKQREILYVPDYVINAGGLIHATLQYERGATEQVHKTIKNIYNSLLTIFERADSEDRSTIEIADIIAEERLQ